ncbi:disintegrin and metalloproteinase domain-containing protein 12-like isoform X3 [Anneissia japonica]|uniref:disintegrin and metalloproteinase domain-containing protein 12-like isoform X3 n=1 Tax=Anneissia japonica TaxID=1529436 RepID=UPI0014258E0D|nr:disintegrin and metalloproteinase domain-containing protein 12-like isoform X3 [Anneissia japonica]
MYLLSYFISLLLLDLGILKSITNARFTENYSINQQEQLSRINNYEIVQPYRLQGRNRRDMSTLTEDGHLKSSTFVIPGTDRQFILDVYLNEDLFPDSYVIISDRPDGQLVTKKPHSKHHCYYHGTVRNTNSSSVAIDTCSGISGVIVADSETFYIEPFEDSESDHLIYKPKDVQWKKKFFDDSKIYKRPDDQEDLENLLALPRQKRDVFTETKYIELVIVADNAEFLLRDGSVKNTEERCKQVANIMDMTYKPLNVRVALASVVVWNLKDKIVFDSDAGKTMSLFQKWRKDDLLSIIKHDNAQFMTGNDFEGSTVGMASLGGMCSIEKSAGVNEDHSPEAAGVAATMCHEMGHNLGFYHDEDTCVCSETREGVGCIMGPVASSTPPTVWSECTKEHLKTALEKGLASCLFNYPVIIYDGPICGNGYVEKGEQCDCGAVEHCDNDCCVAQTCMLHENATCAVGECCENCHLKPAGEECRGMVNECDLPEYCTGHSHECPANVYIQNGETCMNRAEATCYDGQCITYDNMCKTLWGSEATSGIYQCFENNKKGVDYANCGQYDGVYKKCPEKDIKCGKLFCEGGPTYPIIGSLVRSQVLHAYEGNQKHICKTASVDFGTDVPDPGLVVDGARCAPNSVCSNFECKNLTELGITPCPHNCYGNGVCNSNNHCHCDKDWDPPLCRDPGYGGSIDSGPSRPPQTIFPFHTDHGFIDDKVTTTIPIVESDVDTRVTPTIPLLGNDVESTGTCHVANPCFCF